MSDRKPILRAAVAIFVGLAAGVMPTVAAAKTMLAPKPKIGPTEARAIALKTYPGKIMKEELEHERGGSGLRYSFDMRNGKRWREVGIDAMTGRILENSPEMANPKD